MRFKMEKKLVVRRLKIGLEQATWNQIDRYVESMKASGINVNVEGSVADSIEAGIKRIAKADGAKKPMM